MIRLIATDYDGTFCRQGQIDPGYPTAIRAFREAESTDSPRFEAVSPANGGHAAAETASLCRKIFL